MMNKGENQHGLFLANNGNYDDLHFFIGRNKELQFVNSILYGDPSPTRIINLYGLAGTGKTFFLQKINYTLTNQKGKFFYVDCKRFAEDSTFIHSSLVEKIIENTQQNFDAEYAQPVVIAFDHMDDNSHIEAWIRERVFIEIPDHVYLIFVGRKPLRRIWTASPSLQKKMKRQEIKKFTYYDVKLYLEQHGIHHSLIYKLWNFTKGHPLALSLLCSKLDHQQQSFDIKEQFDVIQELVDTFFSEYVHDDQIRKCMEIASVLHYFNEENVANIGEREIPSPIFDRVISLSFVKQGKNGWYLDEFVRTIMNLYARERNPKRYEDISKRAASYYRHKIFSDPHPNYLELYISEYIYHIGDNMIAASFFDQYSLKSYEMETGHSRNFHKVERYFETRKQHVSEYEVEYYHKQDEEKYAFQVSAVHNKKENELIDVKALKALGYDIFKLLKDDSGEIIGLSIIIPINKETIPYLKEMPVSRSYFTRLNEEELVDYSVEGKNKAGWFIRMIDVKNPEETSTRSYMLFSLLPLLLSGGVIICSTPLKMYQELLKRFGFERVKGSTHFDYGPNTPSPTYLLDVRGPRLVGYLDHLAYKLQNKMRLELPKKAFPFSPREFEVAELIMEGYKNAEIAEKLSVSQITIKKHVSSLLKKAEVKNRAQLVRRLLDFVKNKN
ncbi:DNA-binding CsgD family transcriptional regulator/uncharacterized protein YozE (UPF0346 family) [Salirhabdus euzebyi]|uniref:DNA-binding CsgD family transcriptional regulator/uncharacterized protein YozE (UPF0346 family) n=1 Tax=Salirhabdus euzebyi TaxID=394506 RepID=A0A841Q5G9_9BACI|nr:LuxR C-terminal-related transcriptional regulator [Salirhabdus euzebyi]MBB6453603.1 DNA-binding CsgD family transcriptional regulator/uncharacterized protein YozE (UPF0346 family) [Salirhabdus euzebyi]